MTIGTTPPAYTMNTTLVSENSLCYYHYKRLWLIIMLSILLFSVLSRPAQAQQRKEFSLLNINVGQLGIFDNTEGGQRYGLEYRFKSFVGPYGFRLIPSLGIAGAQNSARFIYTDLRHDFYMSAQWLLIPSFGVGLFRNSSDVKLGDTIEFRSGIELAYRFHNDYRTGLVLFHLSNGGISSHNPGTEVLVFSVSIPIK